MRGSDEKKFGQQKRRRQRIAERLLKDPRVRQGIEEAEKEMKRRLANTAIVQEEEA